MAAAKKWLQQNLNTCEYGLFAMVDLWFRRITALADAGWTDSKGRACNKRGLYAFMLRKEDSAASMLKAT